MTKNLNRALHLIKKYGANFENYIEDYGINNLEIAEERYLEDREYYNELY